MRQPCLEIGYNRPALKLQLALALLVALVSGILAIALEGGIVVFAFPAVVFGCFLVPKLTWNKPVLILSENGISVDRNAIGYGNWPAVETIPWNRLHDAGLYAIGRGAKVILLQVDEKKLPEATFWQGKIRNHKYKFLVNDLSCGAEELEKLLKKMISTSPEERKQLIAASATRNL